MKKAYQEKKRLSQRNYNWGFKLGVLFKVEKGEMIYKQAQKTFGMQGLTTLLIWLRKHGTIDWKNPIIHSMKCPNKKEIPTQPIKHLERELVDEKHKNSIMNSMINVFENKYCAELRKKVLPKTILEKQQEKS